MSVAQKDGIDQRSFADQISYEDLYARWEEGNWKATEIDFSEDRKGWEALSEIQRKSALWTYSMFFYGEDSVTDNLSPYIDAAPKEEQKYFLATQQVDEARHSVFFHRFFKEVIGAGESIGSTLAYTEAQLGWGYRNVFDRLDRMGEELRHDRSLPKFAQAIALYHMVVEATLAQPGQHFIEDYFNKAGTMPGFSEGMHNVSRDEQRHIGFGVKTLAECFREIGGVQGGRRRDPARGDALLDGGLRPAGLGPRVHALLRLRARGHLRVRHALGGDEVEGGRLPDRRDAVGRLPVRPLDAARGAGAARDHADARGGRRRAGRQPRLLTGGAGAAVRRDRALGPQGRGQRPSGDDPVALRGRRTLVRADRQRQLRGRAGPGARPDLTLETSWRDFIDLSIRRRRPAPGDAAPKAPAARLAAAALEDAADLPALIAGGRRAGAQSGLIRKRTTSLPAADRLGEVAIRIGEALKGASVGGREHVGHDRLGVEAELQDALGLLAPKDVREVGAVSRIEARQLLADLGVLAARGEQLVEDHVEAGIGLEHRLGPGDQHLDHLVDVSAAATGRRASRSWSPRRFGAPRSGAAPWSRSSSAAARG